MAGLKRQVVRSRAYANWSGKYRRCLADCGEGDAPSARGSEWMVNYTAAETTPDQLRIEALMDRTHPFPSTILHVGVGNSGFARRFAERAARIDGVTVSDAELEHGRSLALPGYTVVLANKYDAGLPERLDGPYDVIVDNNLTSFACCRRHVAGLFHAYSSLLAADGRVLTDRAGMRWTVGDPRWAITERDLNELAAPAGLAVERVTDDILSLTPR